MVMATTQRSSKKLLTATFDRGPARYFHGRKQILRDFHELANDSVDAKGGTIFLIEGAPGVGKSALLHECEKLARSGGWGVAEIYPPAFWAPDTLRDFLDMRKIPKIVSMALRLGWEKIVSTELRIDWHQRTVLKILQKGKRPLLLILDEAQTLGTTTKPPEEFEGTTTIVLDHIHNGKLGRPVILLAAGLNGTKAAFGKLGISRFSQQNIIELGALSRESERAIIQDWITKEGRSKGNPKEWIDSIAQETYGWPQHIQAYVKPAADQLKENSGVMTEDGLSTVLETGRKRKLAYYEDRIEDFSAKERFSLAKLIKNAPSEKGLNKEDILSFLSQEYGKSKAKEMFDQALHKGVLDKRGGYYFIPIPSMQAWLTKEYLPEDIELSLQKVDELETECMEYLDGTMVYTC